MRKRTMYYLLMTAMICSGPVCGQQPSPETLWQPGVALFSFKLFSFEEGLAKSEKTGSNLVEGFHFHKLGGIFNGATLASLTGDQIRRMKSMLASRGLQLRSMYAGGQTEAQWKAIYDKAKALDIHFLVGEPLPELLDYLDSLGKAYGIRLAIHQHARGKSRYWHPDSVLTALEGRTTFGACGDLGHWVRSGLDPVECLRKLEGHLLSIHAKDLDAFGKPDANDVKLGTGVIAYGEIAEELKRQRFDGPVYVECEHDWEDNQTDVNDAVKYLNRLRKQ